MNILAVLSISQTKYAAMMTKERSNKFVNFMTRLFLAAWWHPVFFIYSAGFAPFGSCLTWCLQFKRLLYLALFWSVWILFVDLLLHAFCLVNNIGIDKWKLRQPAVPCCDTVFLLNWCKDASVSSMNIPSHEEYCEIIQVRGAQCSWVSTFLLVRGYGFPCVSYTMSLRKIILICAFLANNGKGYLSYI